MDAETPPTVTLHLAPSLASTDAGPISVHAAGATRRWLSAVGWGWLAIAVAACAPGAPDAASFYSGACTLADATDEPCDSCVDFELAATLGEVDDDGFLVDRGTFGDIVRDHDGNYWIGQRTEIKIFDSAGAYLATVGRAGEGPMEFAFAQPMHTDSRGRIHVFDNRNARVSVIASDGTLSEQRRLPATAVFAMTPLGDGARYAIQAWIRSAERIGFPLHVVDDGGGIVTSFGAPQEGDLGGNVLDDFTSQRRLAVDPSGNIFSSHYDDYIVEAWSEDGTRIGRLDGPVLYDGPIPRRPGTFSWDNPPWNGIHDLMVDSNGRLWIVFRYRRPDWRESMVEVIGSRGRVRLEPKDGTLASYYHSRVDVVDLRACATIASQWHDGVLMNFIGEEMVSEIAYRDDGQEFVNIWRLAYAR